VVVGWVGGGIPTSSRARGGRWKRGPAPARSRRRGGPLVAGAARTSEFSDIRSWVSENSDAGGRTRRAGPSGSRAPLPHPPCGPRGGRMPPPTTGKPPEPSDITEGNTSCVSEKPDHAQPCKLTWEGRGATAFGAPRLPRSPAAEPRHRNRRCGSATVFSDARSRPGPSGRPRATRSHGNSPWERVYPWEHIGTRGPCLIRASGSRIREQVPT